MLVFFCGILVGVFLVLVFAYLYFFFPLGNPKQIQLICDQFPPLRIPSVLARFLHSNEENLFGSKWESCYTLSIIAHFLFQEFKDTRRFRRWFHKRLQLELNDLTTRSAAGLLIQVNNYFGQNFMLKVTIYLDLYKKYTTDVRVRELSIGSEFPVISKVCVESYYMSEDGHGFEELNLLFNVDYTGGFQASVDAALILSRRARLSLKLLHLAGKVRLSFLRKPYSHWSFTFIETPTLDFKVESEWQGRQVKHVIPLITQQFRRILQRKHVFPNYKIRYRPFFPNPLFIPSPPMEAFAHIKIVGGLEVTILQCSRLNVSLASEDHTEVYCTLSLDKRPFLHSSSPHSNHCFTVLINFVRRGLTDPLGLSFNKSVAELGLRAVQISEVARGSTAEKCDFRAGDVILAVNNVPIRNERQATKLLCGTGGELNVLVERTLTDLSVNEAGLVVNNDVVVKGDGDDDGFLLVDGVGKEEISIESVVDGDQKVPERLLKADRKRSNSTSTLGEHMNAVKEAFVEKDDCFFENGMKDFFGSAPENICLLEEPLSASKAEVSLSCDNGFKGVRKTRSTTEIPLDVSNEVDKVFFPVIRRETSASDIIPRSFNAELREEIAIGKNSTVDSVTSVASTSSAASTPVFINELIDENKFEDVYAEAESDVKKPQSRRHRLKVRAFEMAAAGKSKVSDFWYRKKDQNSTPEAVLGEVLHEPQNPVVNEHKKAKKKCDSSRKSLDVNLERNRRNSEQSIASSKTDAESHIFDEKAVPHSKTTRRLQLNENVLWGQSLHFALENEKSKYLNLTVHSVTKIGSHNSLGEANEKISRPSLLGYTSIYIPQIIDDCQLTLSNCHREVFHLRPPPGPILKRARRPSVEKASRHAGFDARLCYGDVLLSFRYFPAGLPPEAGLNFDAETSEEEVLHEILRAESDRKSHTESLSTTSENSSSRHQFQIITLKTAASCVICGGKVWLKSASRCTHCFIICHNKCVSKHLASAPSCIPNAQFDDVGFEFLDSVDTICEPSFLDDTVSHKEVITGLAVPSTSSVPVQAPPLPPPPLPPPPPESLLPSGARDRQLSRRKRIAEKVSEKISSTWNRMGHKHTNVKPIQNLPKPCEEVPDAEREVMLVESVIPDVFEKLQVSGKLCEMKYQPGNAYNEEMISAAKSTGKDIYADLVPMARKKKINEQISKLKTVIDKTTADRMKMLTESNGTVAQGSIEFSALEDRLQALAVLMLHYCSALQNCNEQEEEVLSEEEKQDHENHLVEEMRVEEVKSQNSKNPF